MTTLSNVKKLSVIAAGATCLSLGAMNPAQALGFTGSYAPSNFTLINNNADGSVDTSGSPASIGLAGGNNGSGQFGQTSYLANAVSAGLVSFKWDYFSRDRDGATFDPFGYLLNGSFSQLTQGSLSSQTGLASFAVKAGDKFGFAVQTTDNILGRAGVQISKFDVAPTAIPTPALLPGLVGLGFGVLRKRKAAAMAVEAES